jgi:hypothetical protein
MKTQAEINALILETLNLLALAITARDRPSNVWQGHIQKAIKSMLEIYEAGKQ